MNCLKFIMFIFGFSLVPELTDYDNDQQIRMNSMHPGVTQMSKVIQCYFLANLLENELPEN